MAVTTIAHLRTAIIEALTTDLTADATKPRAIAAANLFNVGMPPGMDATLRSVRAREKPGAFVVIAKMTPDAGVADELGSDHLYHCQIVISRDYYLGYEHRPADISDAFTQCIDDLLRLRAALCWPGALDETAAANATGIAGAALRPVGDQSVLTVDRIGNTRDRLLNARDAFTCPLLYQPE
jgi:hypothetical protein